MPRLHDPLLVMVYADEAVQALLKGDLVSVIVNQNNTSRYVYNVQYYTSTRYSARQGAIYGGLGACYKVFGCRSSKIGNVGGKNHSHIRFKSCSDTPSVQSGQV